MGDIQAIEYKGKKLYKSKQGASTFLVDIENGAKLLSWDISIAGQKRDVIYYEEDSEFCGNPILFPFAGTCSIKGEKFKWESPQGDVLDMPQHGFAKDAKFEIVEMSDSVFCAKMIQEERFRAYYPYEYDFYVSYEFSQFSFSVDLRLENKGQVDIPWCVGNHFYFNVPWHENCTRANYTCSIEAKSAFLYKDCKLEKVPSLKTFDLNNESQINVLHTNLRNTKASLLSKNGEEGVSVEILSQEILSKNTCFVSWAKEDASFYCIEPWLGLANATEHKKGLDIIPAGETKSFKVEVSL